MVHGSLLSPRTKRVQYILEEKRVAYEIIAIDLSKGEQKRDSHLEKQPFGKVPVLEDEDGFVVYGTTILFIWS